MFSFIESVYEDLPEFPMVYNCFSCGLVTSYTRNCPYCGSHLDA